MQSMAPDALIVALKRIASAASEALELKDVFAAVADAAAEILPFDRMSVLQFDGTHTLRLLSFAGSVPAPPLTEVGLEDFSPAVRPSLDGPRRIDDLGPVLSPLYKIDRWWSEQGLRSALWVPIILRGHPAGFLFLASRRPGIFTPEHESALASISALVGLALEHERLWTLDVTRRRRLEAIDQLLPTMAEALEVRGLFDRISKVVQPILPHDRLILVSRSADGRLDTVDALSGDPATAIPSRIDHGPGDPPPMLEYELVRDFEDETDGPRRRVSRLEGIRSALLIRLWVDDMRSASLGFLSRTPRQYSEEDLLVAQKVAAHVSVTLSHQRLAEEQRLAFEARERAAHLEGHVQELKKELETSRGHGRIVGVSKRWNDVLTQAAKVAPTETTVLLTGESGTGKEVIARFIHRGSPRAHGPFTVLNCAALPETLLESELFGYEKGAFTGATTARAGRIQQAEGGVLFLDEIGETTPALQVKLLRVLQEREFQRLGGARPMKADVRIVAATNRDLESAMARGEFREDLYYRLCVFAIHLPPLRERPEDILPLAEAFLEEIGIAVARRAEGISRQAEALLLSYSWPGNVRELHNVLERATILCDGGLITAEHLPNDFAPPSIGGPARAGAASSPEGGLDLNAAEREVLVRALTAAHDNRTHAARLLGITRPQLYRRLRKHRLAALHTSADD